MTRNMTRMIFCLPLLVLILGCGDDDTVSSEEEARAAYMGLDQMIDKAIDLGFKGFNEASSANIDPQTTAGEASGVLTITGKVDQGSSDNKEMRLSVALEGYSDDTEHAGDLDLEITYDTGGVAPALDLSLKNVPSGTLTGSLQGLFMMSGRLTGEVTLSVTMSGTLQPDPLDSAKVQRAPGTTHITGTAQSPYGTYNVDITR